MIGPLTNGALAANAAAMGVVGLYVVCTAPFLPLLMLVHRLQSSYTGLFVAALILQLLPIGLVFFPLGFIGVGLLAYTLVASRRRNQSFLASGLYNPDVRRRWTQEYVLNLWAFAFALEQKGVALVFIQVTSRQGYAGLWQGLLPASVVLWLVIGTLIARELRDLKTLAVGYSSDQR